MAIFSANTRLIKAAKTFQENFFNSKMKELWVQSNSWRLTYVVQTAVQCLMWAHQHNKVAPPWPWGKHLQGGKFPPPHPPPTSTISSQHLSIPSAFYILVRTNFSWKRLIKSNYCSCGYYLEIISWIKLHQVGLTFSIWIFCQVVVILAHPSKTQFKYFWRFLTF